MRTTVDVPDDVFRKAREQAERQGLEVEHFISKAIIKAVTSESSASGPPSHGRVGLPLIKSKGKGPLKVDDDIRGSVETQEDFARHAASLRR